MYKIKTQSKYKKGTGKSMTKIMTKLCSIFFKAALRTRGEIRKRLFFDLSERCYIKALAHTNGISYRAAKFMKELKGMTIR